MIEEDRGIQLYFIHPSSLIILSQDTDLTEIQLIIKIERNKNLLLNIFKISFFFSFSIFKNSGTSLRGQTRNKLNQLIHNYFVSITSREWSFSIAALIFPESYHLQSFNTRFHKYLPLQSNPWIFLTYYQLSYSSKMLD